METLDNILDNIAYEFALSNLSEDEFKKFEKKVEDGYAPSYILYELTGNHKPRYIMLTEEERDWQIKITEQLPEIGADLGVSEIDLKEIAYDLYNSKVIDVETAVETATRGPNYCFFAAGVEESAADYLLGRIDPITPSIEGVDKYFTPDFMLLLGSLSDQDTRTRFMECNLSDIEPDDFDEENIEALKENDAMFLLEKYLPDVYEVLSEQYNLEEDEELEKKFDNIAYEFALSNLSEDEFKKFEEKVEDGYAPSYIFYELTGSHKPPYMLTEEERDWQIEITEQLPEIAVDLGVSEIELKEIGEVLYNSNVIDVETAVETATRDPKYCFFAVGVEESAVDFLLGRTDPITPSIEEVDKYYTPDFMLVLGSLSDQDRRTYFMDCNLGDIEPDDFDEYNIEALKENGAMFLLENYLPDVYEVLTEQYNLEEDEELEM